jgi:hypothetical protein
MALVETDGFVHIIGDALSKCTLSGDDSKLAHIMKTYDDALKTAEENYITNFTREMLERRNCVACHYAEFSNCWHGTYDNMCTQFHNEKLKQRDIALIDAMKECKKHSIPIPAKFQHLYVKIVRTQYDEDISPMFKGGFSGDGLFYGSTSGYRSSRDGMFDAAKAYVIHSFNKYGMNVPDYFYKCN